MKKVKLSEESYVKLKENLIKESSFGNDDLGNLFEELRMSFTDFKNALNEHMIMCNRMHEEPNPYVKEILEHADAIENIMNQIG